MEKPSNKTVDKLVKEIVIGSTIISRRYGPKRVAAALRTLAESFDREFANSFDLTKSDFGFNEEHWFV